jgi:hypothetical protein
MNAITAHQRGARRDGCRWFGAESSRAWGEKTGSCFFPLSPGQGQKSVQPLLEDRTLVRISKSTAKPAPGDVGSLASPGLSIDSDKKYSP